MTESRAHIVVIGNEKGGSGKTRTAVHLAVALARLKQRVAAIVLGRWTPSPQERDAIAAVFGLTRDQIVWGHKTPIQHLYGHGPG